MSRTDTVSEVHAPSERVSVPVSQQLFVVLTCDRPLCGGARHGLDQLDEVVVGRGDARTARRALAEGVRKLFVTLPGRMLSGTHARFVRTASRWWVEDCHSTNGSYVNGRRIERVPLVDGDIIELGRNLLVYREGVPTPAASPADLDVDDLSAREPGLSTLLPWIADEIVALESVARSALPVFLLGESGTGKELLARAVHRLSGRAGPLVPVNCGAIPESLVEGQLFGHVKGAFSGAVRDEPGLVRAAHGGTLLLDEIGDLPAVSQAALLRVLQEGEVQSVGSTRWTKVDVRVIAATHRPIAELVGQERFRGDLFARLNGYRFTAAPLRMRREDLPVLLRALLPRVCAAPEDVTFTPSAAHALLRYGWPANVRELQHVLSRATVLSHSGRIERQHLPAEMSDPEGTPEAPRPPPETSEEELREDRLRHRLLAALEEHEGNVSEVARAMGKARMQIQRWLKRFAINANAYRR
jgi:DNA-binding NtrC family response regulator